MNIKSLIIDASDALTLGKRGYRPLSVLEKKYIFNEKVVWLARVLFLVPGFLLPMALFINVMNSSGSKWQTVNPISVLPYAAVYLAYAVIILPCVLFVILKALRLIKPR